jgi:F-type H+-transporting ATPase subunit a
MKLGSLPSRALGACLCGALLVLAPAAVHAQDAHAATATSTAAQPADSTRSALDAAAATANEQATREAQHGTGAPVVGEQLPGGHGAAGAHHATKLNECAEHDPADIITPHITDSNCIEFPNFPKFWTSHQVPVWRSEHPLMLGPIDITPTKHVVMLLFAAVLTLVIMLWAAAAHRRHHHAVGRPRGFAAGIEAMVLFIRNEVAIPNLGGHGGYKYAPFILTLFFFILFANLLGLIPYGATATGNISVTATLAIVTFLVIEFAGMRAQGLHYLGTIFYWNKDLNIVMRVLMFLIMTPVEIVGKISKPFALAVRLFANMTAGHIVVLALIGLIFTFKSWAIGTAPLLMAVAIMMLELFVAFLQAFIFSLLASVFIGQIREAHH